MPGFTIRNNILKDNEFVVIPLTVLVYWVTKYWFDEKVKDETLYSF